jgi:hemoglobin-like flavoprotein
MHWSSINLVRNNAASLAPRAPQFADDFLEQLVRQCPELSRSLTWDREQRRRQIVEAFALVLRTAPTTHQLSIRLTAIGAANERRGVRAPHYQLGRDVLLTLLAQYNGTSWSTGLAQAWSDFLDYTLIHLAPPASFDEALAA